MRKFILALAVLPFLLAGCTKETIVHVHQGCVESFYIDVYPNHWVDDPGLTYIYATFVAPEITTGVIEDGIVVAYYIDGDGRDNMLPYLLPYRDDSTDELYYENVRFDMSQGKITFIIEDSDFYHATVNHLMKFKVSVAK
jgi:hypothetical protein